MKPAIWFMRIAYTFVFAMNVYCALVFVLDPAGYAGAYELSGVPGRVAVQGIGVAFLMWNCTYPLVIWQPAKHRTLAFVVLAQQAVGLIGETAILWSFSAAEHVVLAASIERFILFDAVGLVLMLAAFIVLEIFSRRCKAQ